MADYGPIGVGYDDFRPVNLFNPEYHVMGVCVGYDSTSMDGFSVDVYAGVTEESGCLGAAGAYEVDTTAAETVAGGESVSLVFLRDILEAVIADEASQGDIITLLVERIAAVDGVGHSASTTTAYSDHIAAAGVLVQVIEQMIAEIAAGDEASYIATAVAVADLIAASGITTNQSAIIQAIAELVVGLEVIRAGRQEAINESAEGVSVITNLLRATQAVLAQALVTETSTSYLLLVNMISESSQASEAVSLWQSLMQSIEEGATAFVHLTFNGETYTGWVMNTANGAASEYQGLNFNSLCKIGNRYFGASDTGIHEIAGNDDDGTSIATYVQSGLIDFGTALEKSVPVAYLGADVDGRVALGVSVSEKAGVSTYWYEANRELAAINNVKVPIGKGLSGRYWKFGIASDALSEFDAVTVIPVTLKRRV